MFTFKSTCIFHVTAYGSRVPTSIISERAALTKCDFKFLLFLKPIIGDVNRADVNRGYCMLLLFLFVLLFLCVCVCVCVCVPFFLTRDSNMISIGTVEFRYYVAVIIPLKLGKP